MDKVGGEEWAAFPTLPSLCVLSFSLSTFSLEFLGLFPASLVKFENIAYVKAKAIKRENGISQRRHLVLHGPDV